MGGNGQAAEGKVGKAYSLDMRTERTKCNVELEKGKLHK